MRSDCAHAGSQPQQSSRTHPLNPLGRAHAPSTIANNCKPVSGFAAVAKRCPRRHNGARTATSPLSETHGRFALAFTTPIASDKGQRDRDVAMPRLASAKHSPPQCSSQNESQADWRHERPESELSPHPSPQTKANGIGSLQCLAWRAPSTPPQCSPQDESQRPCATSDQRATTQRLVQRAPSGGVRVSRKADQSIPRPAHPPHGAAPTASKRNSAQAEPRARPRLCCVQVQRRPSQRTGDGEGNDQAGSAHSLPPG